MGIGLAVLYSAGAETPRLVLRAGRALRRGPGGDVGALAHAAHAAAPLVAAGVRRLAAAAAARARDRAGQARQPLDQPRRLLFPAVGSDQAEPADDGRLVPAARTAAAELPRRADRPAC